MEVEQELGDHWETIQAVGGFVHGSFVHLWADRPLLEQTKREIDLLILCLNRYQVCLPKLVLQRIAYWIQSIDLFQDYHEGKLGLVVDIDPNKVGTMRDQVEAMMDSEPLFTKHCTITIGWGAPRDQEGQLEFLYQYGQAKLAQSDHIQYFPMLESSGWHPGIQCHHICRWHQLRLLRDLGEKMQQFVREWDRYRLPLKTKIREHIEFCKTISLGYDPFIEC